MASLTETENQLVDDCYIFINELAIDAGKLVKEGFTRVTKSVEFKTSSFDLVTEYDRRCEELLIQGIRNKYPTHK